MRQLSLKRQSSLALVAAPETRTQVASFKVNGYLLDRSFYGWLPESGIRSVERYRRPLSTEDFLQVELATVREGHNHRRWPPDIIQKFMRADVIER